MTDQPTTYYTVQPGDTFHTLAQLCYRDRNKWTVIRQANPALQGIEPDHPLRIGTQLNLPVISELTTTILTEEGDTLHALAAFFYFSESQWTRIQANPPLQVSDPDQPLPVGTQLTLPFIPERTIILITKQGDTLHTFAQNYYNDQNQWVRFGETNPPLQGFDPDQALPAGLQVLLSFIPQLATALRIEQGDTLHALAKFFYNDEKQWQRIRQINPPLQGFDPDQSLPAGLELTLPSFVDFKVIVTEQGDTLRALSQTYYHNENQWQRIRQINPPLQGFSAEQPLPVGFQLTLQFFRITVERAFTTGNDDTFSTLALNIYHDVNKWPVIRQANVALQQYNNNQILPAGFVLTIP